MGSSGCVGVNGQVSRMGVTVAAVVHQPSYEIFAMFDDLLLLCEGGRTAFYGGVTSVQVHYHALLRSPNLIFTIPSSQESLTSIAKLLSPEDVYFANGTAQKCVKKVGASCLRACWLIWQGYFEGLGYSVPVHANPADIFMDIVAGVAPRSRQPAMGNAHVQGTMSPPRAIFAQHAAEVWSTFNALPAWWA